MNSELHDCCVMFLVLVKVRFATRETDKNEIGTDGRDRFYGWLKTGDLLMLRRAIGEPVDSSYRVEIML
ncbi:MAG: hypothetical protein U0990_09720 [Candidatus Nanopelagicales bacterium]|nr:hypothetical protein [Candidatus Nanopelagicales bacterium]